MIKLKSLLNFYSDFYFITRSTACKFSTCTPHRQLKSWKEIPGPSSVPVIGQLHHFLPGGSLHNCTGFEFQDKLYTNYGPIVKLDRIFAGRPGIFVYDLDSVAQVLRGENWLPVRPGFQILYYYRNFYNQPKGGATQPTGLISDHGEKWKQIRSMVNPIVMQPNVVNLYSKISEEVSEDLIKRLRLLRDENNMIKDNFDYQMNLWALESVSAIALGERLNALDENLSEDSPAKKLINYVHEFFAIAEDLDYKPSLWRYISTPAYRRAMKVFSSIDEITLSFVKKAREKLKNDIEKPDELKSVLEKLLEIDERIALIMASDLLFTGVDTVGNTMSATLYLLASNPEKQRILREEVMSRDEKKTYLKACIKESFRVMPVTGGNGRLTTREYNLLGYQVPKDMFMVFPHQYFSKMEDQFPRANEFIPERWIVDKDDPLYHGHAHPFAYSPFGFGARICIGRRIADLELETLISKMVENFQIDWVGPPPTMYQCSLNYFKGPFNFVFNDIK
ncbi:cytochrome P450 CYP12A2-like [Leptidea sinapis]|uniref:cytochrome P450 CYP12A2-like n=1 Tax=Leptidea sinapis TaxID=189913 RepID=UPI00213D6E04|nr:cytochrome P450 CYP12A2-like [Leptidea sinapis]